MKKLEIIIKPGKLDDLQELLEISEYHGIMITNIMGCGNQRGNVGYTKKYRGAAASLNLLPKLKVECVVTGEEAEQITRQVCKEIRTGNYGDGKIFIYNVEEAVRIRTGESGEDAL
ncbi:P-II family nitrogen regulator [Faecalicatena contorta]|uniref:P-II family nitrogen regulator n=1 Tax=Faecalicatena contorta TaxID=39482 RepID=UPI001F3DF79C|nr:P-II family nitrogen regulator [Faecalicatena contorta]MCF2683134.1 P-II family nitrogen regulator [Faecalicatena contorta]